LLLLLGSGVLIGLPGASRLPVWGLLPLAGWRVLGGGDVVGGGGGDCGAVVAVVPLVAVVVEVGGALLVVPGGEGLLEGCFYLQILHHPKEEI